MTLVLGQPGSGKSTLMKVLTEIKKQLPQFLSYVPQHDKHFATLTVRETLEYAQEFCGGELKRRAGELLTQGKPDENAEAMAVAKAVTIVGDALLRGVSGGERKRVTTGEMEFGMKYMTLMDEISTGLDSAATFDIINTQRSIAHRYHKTVVIALLQPAPEVVALFDDLLILNAGEIMYHGPMSEVVPYFSGLGFETRIECPPGRDWSSLYRTTRIRKHMKPMPEFHQSFHASAVTLLRRQMFIIGRNKPYIFGRALLVTVMGLLYATTFYQFDPTEIQVVMGIIFAGTLFLSLSQASQLPTFIAARDIFYKQRGANFYRTASYVVANSVSQLPLCITETLIFGTLVYWMCGFVSEILEFLLFLLVPFMTNFGLGSFFFVLTAAAPSINIATPISMASTLIFIIFAGFIVTEGPDPQGFFIWLYWITPRTPMGQYYLQLFDLKTEKIWIFYCVIYMAVFYVTCMTLGYLALEYKRYETPENVGVASRNSSFTPVTVAFKDLRYSVPKPSNPKESIELLKGISGFALPGQMTALMGASGAGKTTLMDVIAHRKTCGTISGQILLNGYEANDLHDP
ncbi:ATP-binding Cassette (ABC) Superfamily [Phytophthora infestans T30-4]|uniref:ATP-binding Cassette (ABC) Superfamily n=1 Tax=Phytophthora infestans (strain T30-4) TaxID=403677 RepID=D0P221_PHYIT|nr:ATP-binding Cassette (ABC) Superfamily [Phytophthora infestans T30-4]EEY55167.1 ATP-binding Cassette (ABC) Superfamily [Phytophthora infestans T30-4]|eukprot:XP_002895666.1 ATP-binding Cassette (ABC) Superfamily [Phytophthora infestans T30-4]